jgi:hypothetical protein
MKRIVIVVLMVFISASSFAQKKKPVAKKTATTTVAKGILAKADNLVAEIKNGSFQVTINENGKAKDAIIVKAVDAKFAPTNTKLTAFKANGVSLYVLTWTEIAVIKTDLKTENLTNIYSVVYEISNKKQVFSNTQTTNHIVEKVFLDKLKTASETQERIRREGFEFILNADGTITQKNKTQENKWKYDPATFEFVDVKKK